MKDRHFPEPSLASPASGLTEHPAAPGEARLLLPVGYRYMPAAPIAYVEGLAQMGRVVSVCLLHVEEELGLWAMLRRFRSGEITSGRAAEPLLRTVSGRLTALGVPHATYLRTGEVVFAILDTAEQLNCTGIVVPSATTAFRHRWAAGGTLPALHKRKRGIPVITIGDNGLPSRPQAK